MESKECFPYPDEFVFEGMHFPAYLTEQNLRTAASFNFQDDDIVVFTYPRAGTTWIQEIVYLVNSYCDFETAGQVKLEQRFPFMEDKGFTDALQKLKAPRLLKTHLPYRLFKDSLEGKKTRIIVMMRNPKDILVSFYNIHKMFSSFGKYMTSWDQFFERYRQGKMNYGDPIEWNKEWWVNTKDLPNVAILSYESMKRDHKNGVQHIAAFLDRKLTEEQINSIVEHTSFTKMRDNPMVNKSTNPGFDMTHTKHIRKGEVGDWRNYFTEEQSDYVDKACAEKLAGTGLEFQYSI